MGGFCKCGLDHGVMRTDCRTSVKDELGLELKVWRWGGGAVWLSRWQTGGTNPVLVLTRGGGRRIGATENKPLFAAGNGPKAAPNPPSDLPDTDSTHRIGIQPGVEFAGLTI